jgi:DNA-binding CsgD family transcriptional regulator
MQLTNEVRAFKFLTSQILREIGNTHPTERQIHLTSLLLTSTTINQQLVFHKVLSPKEMNCLLLAAKGITMEEAAKLLNVKYSTIETWHKKIKLKLGCRSIAQAVFEGMRFGYLQPQLHIPKSRERQ